MLVIHVKKDTQKKGANKLQLSMQLDLMTDKPDDKFLQGYPSTDFIEKFKAQHNLKGKFEPTRYDPSQYMFQQGFRDFLETGMESLQRTQDEIKQLKQEYSELRHETPSRRRLTKKIEELTTEIEQKDLPKDILKKKLHSLSRYEEKWRKAISQNADLKALKELIAFHKKEVKSIKSQIAALESMLDESGRNTKVGTFNYFGSQLGNEIKFVTDSDGLKYVSLNVEAIIAYMEKHPLDANVSPEKAARHLKNCLLAGLDETAREKLMHELTRLDKEVDVTKDIQPKKFFETKYFEEPESIEKWITNLHDLIEHVNMHYRPEKDMHSEKILKM